MCFPTFPQPTLLPTLALFPQTFQLAQGRLDWGAGTGTGTDRQGKLTQVAACGGGSIYGSMAWQDRVCRDRAVWASRDGSTAKLWFCLLSGGLHARETMAWHAMLPCMGMAGWERSHWTVVSERAQLTEVESSGSLGRNEGGKECGVPPMILFWDSECCSAAVPWAVDDWILLVRVTVTSSVSRCHDVQYHTKVQGVILMCCYKCHSIVYHNHRRA